MKTQKRKWMVSLAVLFVIGAGLLGWIWQASRRDENARRVWQEEQQKETEKQQGKDGRGESRTDKEQGQMAASGGQEAGKDKKDETQGNGEGAPSGEGKESGKANAAGQDQQREVTMAFAGDILFSSYVLGNYDREGISGIVSEGLLAQMQQADFFMANEEFPFSTGGVQAQDKQFTFRADPSYASVLKELGLDVVTLANNHALDYGKEALSDTFEALDQAGIAYAGAGDSRERAAQPYVAEAGGKTFGFLAASRVIPEVGWNIDNQQPGLLCTYDSASLVQAIRETKANCDYVTVYVHWGIEREDTPQEYQRTLAKAYIDAGADLVVGAHPHVLQGIEYYNGKPILYSLGNYMFNQTIASTMLLRTVVTSENTTALRIIPAHSASAKTQEMNPQESEALYRYLESISFGISIDAEGNITPK